MEIRHYLQYQVTVFPLALVSREDQRGWTLVVDRSLSRCTTLHRDVQRALHRATNVRQSLSSVRDCGAQFDAELMPRPTSPPTQRITRSSTRRPPSPPRPQQQQQPSLSPSPPSSSPPSLQPMLPPLPKRPLLPTMLPTDADAGHQTDVPDTVNSHQRRHQRQVQNRPTQENPQTEGSFRPTILPRSTARHHHDDTTDDKAIGTNQATNSPSCHRLLPSAASQERQRERQDTPSQDNADPEVAAAAATNTDNDATAHTEGQQKTNNVK